MSISNLFKKSNEKDTAAKAIEQKDDTRPNNNTFTDRWQQDGVDTAGKMGGVEAALETSLQVVVQKVKQQQAGNERSQAKWRQEKENEQTNYKTKIEKDKNELSLLEGRKNDYEKQKLALTGKQKEFETNQRTNKNALINFIFGLVILTGLTVYLFIFYSSTAYSAFFKEFGADNTVITEAMFDSDALANALADGVTELFFVILIPTIFLGVGYVLHQFGSGTDSKQTKLLKTLSLYALVFIFDCFLAYKISQSIYNVMIEQSLEQMPPYSFSLAAGNVDFWTVIFCGFVAYVVWGLIFSFVMSNYASLHKHTVEINRIGQEITDLDKRINTVTEDIVKMKNEIAQLEGEVEKIASLLKSGVVYNWTDIKNALASFMKGWLSFLNIQNRDAKDIKRATEIYDKFTADIDDMLSGKQAK